MKLNRCGFAIIAVLAGCCIGTILLSSRFRWMTEISHFSTETNIPATSVIRIQHQEKADEARTQHSNVANRLEFSSVLTDELALRISNLKAFSSPVIGGKNGTVTERDEGNVFNTSGLDCNKAAGFFQNIISKGKLDFRDVAEYSPGDEFLTSMDREILADEAVKDLTTVASLNTSLLQLVGREQGTKVSVGDKVTVRVILKDLKGRPVTKGGDVVRVWVVSRRKPKRSAAVDVTDLRNGTYVASLPVLWPGLVEVRAAVQRPREFRRVAMSVMNSMKTMNHILSCFMSGTKEEATLCSFIPVVPGYQEVCNLTTLNSGLPWYCGRPSTPGIKCQHWAMAKYLNFPRHFPVTKTENDLLVPYIFQSQCHRYLQQTISLSAVEAGPQKEAPVNPNICRPLKPRETWEDQSPRGYWEGKTWRALIGCPLPELNSSAVFNCLHDTVFISLGDSNARRVTEQLIGYTKCPQVDRIQFNRQRHQIPWHVPQFFHCPRHNLRIAWYPHAHPFYGPKWTEPRLKKSPRFRLDRLPATGNYVILIHLYMHFAVEHTYVYAQHVRDTARGVRDLLKRNPNVKVFVRGPHVVDNKLFCFYSDLHVSRSLRVLHREFEDLKDRVVLLNLVDMTIANENCRMHAVNAVMRTVCKMIISHLCPK